MTIKENFFGPDSDDKDALGTRMKFFEGIEAQRKLDPSLPILVRLDGRHFHTFTKGLNRPFDIRFNNCMKTTTRVVLEESNAKIAYTQSDEISLVILNKPESEPFFGARAQKLCSILASVASVVFNNEVREYLPEKINLLPTFDCRVWNVPSLVEASNAILWRELDAEKNSIQMLAQSIFSHKSLQGKHAGVLKEMLREAKNPWESLPEQFQRGVYFKRITKTCKCSSEELQSLPEKHQARKNPDLVFERSSIQEIRLPRLIENNLEDRMSLLFKE